MDIGQILASAVSSIVGVFLAGQLVRWQQARAARNSATGRPVTVSASIRAAERGRLGGVWRHGSVKIDGDRVVWTPRTPWGRPLVLDGVAYGSRRAPKGPLRWLVPPAAVVMPCSEAERGYELAVLPGSVKYLFWAQVAA